MPIQFAKMHGLGNDFIVIDAVTTPLSIQTLSIPTLANRHTGIGFDQLLLITSSTSAHFACRIFNADGSEAEQCGNGMRCVARFIHEQKLSSDTTITLETKAGLIKTTLQDPGTYHAIEVDMGIPCFEPALIPFESILAPSGLLSVLSLGNPHAILLVDSIKEDAIARQGQKLSVHPAFPKGVNVGFMEKVTPNHIRLRTIERGAGETLACGSNACAAVVAGIQHRLLDNRVRVELTFGDLWIQWGDTATSPITMIGPAEQVFMGNVTC